MSLSKENTSSYSSFKLSCLTLPSPKERVLMKREAQVLSFGEDLGEAKMLIVPLT